VAGYSPRALVDKLGIKAGARVALVGAPEGFEAALSPLPDGTRLARRLRKGADVAVMFTTSSAELAKRWGALSAAVGPSGAVWVAWPKRASGVATDMTENVVRDVVLPTGWVDTKVCAIDDTWSGLRCVLRRALRPAPGAAMTSARPHAP
jgi:hypothetical protein